MRFFKLKVFTLLAAALLLFSVRAAFGQSAQENIPEAIAVAEPELEAQAKPTIRPLTVAAGLFDDTMITGTLTDSTAIDIKTAFGQASIPLSEVAGIRFPLGEDTATTVVMLNGDSITGATDLKFVAVETTWGSAKINGQNIATMLFVPGLKWTSTDALGGKRWTLVEATSPAPTRNVPASGSQGMNRVQPASGSRSSIPQGRPINPTTGRSFPFNP